MSACVTQDMESEVRWRMAVCKELLLVQCSDASIVALCLKHGFYQGQRFSLSAVHLCPVWI
jgi:hypothetical protein